MRENVDCFVVQVKQTQEAMPAISQMSIPLVNVLVELKIFGHLVNRKQLIRIQGEEILWETAPSDTTIATSTCRISAWGTVVFTVRMVACRSWEEEK